MAQETLEKINRRVSKLKGEVKILRSLVIGLLGKDREGEYKPEFVKKVLKSSQEKESFVFKNSKSFLKKHV